MAPLQNQPLPENRISAPQNANKLNRNKTFRRVVVIKNGVFVSSPTLKGRNLS